MNFQVHSKYMGKMSWKLISIGKIGANMCQTALLTNIVMMNFMAHKSILLDFYCK